MAKVLSLTWIVLTALAPVRVQASADTEALSEVLKKLDGLVCTQPEKISDHYAPKQVILADDKRYLLENRIEGYRQMMSEFRGMECKTQRQVLSGRIGDKVGFLLVDEISSITSKSTDTDERQHSVCSYVFQKDNRSWKIALEHCSSLPDYSINPGDDALYYFHNPVY